MSDLLPCPLCGGSKGYELAKGDTSRWWFAVCAGCGDFVCECRSDSSTGYNAELPTHWGPADLEWNRAAKHAHELRLGLDSANAENERLQHDCQNFLNEIERLRAELDDAQVSGLKSEASIIKLCAEFNAVEIRCRKMKRAADYYLERAESAELESTRLTAERDRALDRIAAMAADLDAPHAWHHLHHGLRYERGDGDGWFPLYMMAKPEDAP